MYFRCLKLILIFYIFNLINNCLVSSSNYQVENAYFKSNQNSDLNVELKKKIDDLKITYAAESLILGQKKNDEPFGGVIFVMQFADEFIEIQGVICNLKPNSQHGLHIHKFGEIYPYCNTTLGDYNPYKQKHGAHKNDRIEDRHLGDLGNIIADKNGIATFKIKDYNLKIDQNPIFSILGRSFVLHSKADDLGNNKTNYPESKRNGNSGKEVACGVIGIAKVESLLSKPLSCHFN